MTGAESREATEDSALPGPTSEMPEPAADQKAPEDSQLEPSAPPASQASQELPPGFLYKVFPFFIFKSGGQSSFLCFEALLLTPLVSRCLLLLCHADSLSVPLSTPPTSHCNRAGFLCCGQGNYSDFFPLLATDSETLGPVVVSGFMPSIRLPSAHRRARWGPPALGSPAPRGITHTPLRARNRNPHSTLAPGYSAGHRAGSQEIF